MVARPLPPSRPPSPRKLTRGEFDRMGALDFFHGERVELIRGTVVRMAPIGPYHASLVQRLAELLLPSLLGRATVRIQQPLVAFDDSEPEPDIAIVPLGAYAHEHPKGALLVIEVAESSLAYDRDTKAPIYAASSVVEYWIVDVAGRAVEIYAKPAGELYTSVRRCQGSDRVSPEAFPEVGTAVDELFS